MQREFPVIIKKNGEKFIPQFPVKLEEGDELIVVKEMFGSRVPNGETWEVGGYSSSGPIVNKF